MNAVTTPGSSNITIAVVDDHDVIHAGVNLWCAQAQPAVRVAGSYTSADELLEHYPHPRGEIDVVTVDLELTSRRPDVDGLARIIDAGHRAVVFSHLVDTEVILRCLDVGATSYVVKTEGKAHLLEALHAAADDTAHVSPRMAAALAKQCTDGRPNLADRERQVLVAWFQTENKELVARRLDIKPTTVSTYLQRARAKYAAVGRPAHTKAALLARAIQDGIVSVDDL